MQVTPFLDFGGRCDEALAFYGQTLGARTTFLSRYRDAPPEPGQPQPSAAWADKVMFASVQIGETRLMASDGREGQTPAFSGIALAVRDVSYAEGERLFAALSAGGQVLTPYQKMSWTEGFGMLTDRFGVAWMVVCEH